jgi:hypothetical protein
MMLVAAKGCRMKDDQGNSTDRRHPVVKQIVKIAAFHEYGPVPAPFAANVPTV